MYTLIKKLSPICLILLTFALIDSGVTTQYADARSKMGGRMFSRPTPKKAPAQQNMQRPAQSNQKQKGGFGKGLAGGLLGGALGAMLFGSLFGAAGEGMGLIPILLLAGVGFFLFRRMTKKAGAGSGGGFSPGGAFGSQPQQGGFQEHEQQATYMTPAEQGLAEITSADRNFDQGYFMEIASDVFFQVQAGWMRRDLDSYRHLLGDQLASEYENHFEEMRQAGQINKLESIAIRKVEIVNAGSEGGEDFITVLFTANLLDYTVDENSGEVVSGSNTTPVKFGEEWTWARSTGTDNWLLEGINVVNG